MSRQSSHVVTNLPSVTKREDLPDTVAAPVELLKRIRLYFPPGSNSIDGELDALIPKRKPQVVAVHIDGLLLHAGDPNLVEQISSMPDLLDMLDGAVDGIPTFTEESRHLVKARFREALGMNL